LAALSLVANLRLLKPSYTTDAGMIGNYLGPDEAFRFARGETVTLREEYEDVQVE
jgi:hypothetical protein